MIEFRGGIPTNLSQCTNLYYLILIDNELTGGIVLEIAPLVNLQHVGLSINLLSGTIPPFLGNLTDLSQLSLSECGLQGEIPESLAQLRRLQLLNVGDNNLTGTIPLGLYNVSSMEYFIVSNDHLQGNIHSDIGSTLPRLKFLCLHHNHFSGTLPPSLSNCSVIESIEVSSNNFTGNMIVDFTRLSVLQRLLAASNPFNGDIVAQIPPEIFKLSSISIELDLSHNILTGIIPSEVGALRNIGLSGTIHTSLGSCVMLSSLYLGENSLQGEIPDSLNSLRGEVPTLGVFQNESAISLEGNQGLCGGIAILNLPSCPTSPKSNKKGTGKILIPTIVGTICLALAFCLRVIIMYKQRTLQNVGTPIFQGSDFLRLSYADLVSATEGFSETHLLGIGRFGSVYKGTINDDDEQIELAVKVLDLRHFVSTALTDHVTEVVDPFMHQQLNVDEKYWDCIVSILRIGMRCSKLLPRDRMSMAEVANDLKKIRNMFPVYKNATNVAVIFTVNGFQ
ncbi:receptor kinase-like protein Xa21 [Salvia splendens]|uniref:receptor kinase-like protein Xa21 n=1 Tax=Salvia splendens TaxID=180675 RepID=UPI001C26865F|nr:receptor kinase-like protein Xa21 [Salvia splendens]